MSASIELCLSHAICLGKWDTCTTLARKSPYQAKSFAYKAGSIWQGKHIFNKSLQGLPLHEAVLVGAPPKVITALCSAYPKGICKRELVYKRLPIHLALMSKKVDPKVVRLLSKYCVGSLAEPDKLGNVPLYYALKYNATTDANDATIQNILQLSPNTAKAQNKNGIVPLHVACSVGASEKVIALLLKLHPDASVMVTNNGKDAMWFCEKCKAPNHSIISDMLKTCSRHVHAQVRYAAEPSSRRLIV